MITTILAALTIASCPYLITSQSTPNEPLSTTDTTTIINNADTNETIPVITNNTSPTIINIIPVSLNVSINLPTSASGQENNTAITDTILTNISNVTIPDILETNSNNSVSDLQTTTAVLTELSNVSPTISSETMIETANNTEIINILSTFSTPSIGLETTTTDLITAMPSTTALVPSSLTNSSTNTTIMLNITTIIPNNITPSATFSSIMNVTSITPTVSSLSTNDLDLVNRIDTTSNDVQPIVPTADVRFALSGPNFTILTTRPPMANTPPPLVGPLLPTFLPPFITLPPLSPLPIPTVPPPVSTLPPPIITPPPIPSLPPPIITPLPIPTIPPPVSTPFPTLPPPILTPPPIPTLPPPIITPLPIPTVPPPVSTRFPTLPPPIITPPPIPTLPPPIITPLPIPTIPPPVSTPFPTLPPPIITPPPIPTLPPPIIRPLPIPTFPPPILTPLPIPPRPIPTLPPTSPVFTFPPIITNLPPFLPLPAITPPSNTPIYDYVCVPIGSCIPLTNIGIDIRITGSTCPFNLIPCPSNIAALSNCGVHYRQNFTTIDGNTSPGAYPWQIFLRNQTQFIGSGILINPWYVITAAHKVFLNRDFPQNIQILLGVWDPAAMINVQIRFASTIITHPLYNPTTLKNDIAVIRLNIPAQFGPQFNVGFACLPSPSEIFIGRNCMVSGWGNTQFLSNDAPTSPQKQILVPIVSYETCRTSLMQPTVLGANVDIYLDPLGEICAGGEENKDACTMDGGSPLSCYNPATRRTTIAGLVIWGKGCKRKGVHGVYVNLAYYVNWIQSIISTLSVNL